MALCLSGWLTPGHMLFCFLFSLPCSSLPGQSSFWAPAFDPRTCPDYLLLLLIDLVSSRFLRWWLWLCMIVELSDFVFPAQSSQTGLFSSLPSLVVLTCSLVYRFPEPVPELVWGGCCWRGVGCEAVWACKQEEESFWIPYLPPWSPGPSAPSPCIYSALCSL